MGHQAWQSVGFRFRPTQQELICLLQEKARGSAISTFTNFVLEKNLYGKEGMEPWKVFSDVDNNRWGFYDDIGKNDKKRVLYVVTDLSKLSAKKIGRTAGCGTWDGQTKGQPVWDYQGSKIVGYMKLLNYTVEAGYESEASGKGYWYMHEFSLSEDSLREIRVKSTDYVVCRIVKDNSKSCCVKSPNKKNVIARGVKSGDVAVGSSQIDQKSPTRINDKCGTSGSSMRPQQISGTCSGFQQMDVSHQQVMGTCPRVEGNSVTVIDDDANANQQVIVGTCRGAEGNNLIVIDEEENLHQANVGEIMNFPPANNSITTLPDNDWMDFHWMDFEPGELFELLYEDEPGDTAPTGDTAPNT